MRRTGSLAALAAAASLVASPSALSASWAQPQIRVAVESGLMGPSVDAFRPGASLTRGELGQIAAGLTGKPQVVVDPSRRVALAQFHRRVVSVLGLRRAARAVRAELDASRLEPTGRVGFETVARLLSLRYNHPAAYDYRELIPGSALNRAEAAYSVARVLRLSDWEIARARELALSFELPSLTKWQRRVLARALRFVGYPYVWGGMSERTQTVFGVTSRGGFDCSGFVWRVYKLEPFAGAPRLGTTLRGRTTYELSGEFPRSERIARAHLRPADLVFFGERGPRSRPAEVGHMGIYVGRGWFVHSSGNGTTLARLDGWYADKFAWGRRPLAEVGLR